MASLVRHRTENPGKAHTAGVSTQTIAKYKLRANWAATLVITVNARNDGSGVAAAWQYIVAAHADGAGAVTIDGISPGIITGDAALSAIALTIDGATNPGFVSVITPGLVGVGIWWNADIDVWGNGFF